MDKLAVIHALWIGEVKPDFVSGLIQRVLSTFTKKNIDYSHNAFIYEKTGKLWEATFDDDPKKCGVVENDPKEAMKDCVIRARKRIVLNITERDFERFLAREKGKPYAHGQNWATVFKWMTPWTKNGVKERHCSELLAAAASFGPYKFPRNKDAIKPSDTFRIIQPEIVNEVVDSSWTFSK